jgi:hypothetical protein
MGGVTDFAAVHRGGDATPEASSGDELDTSGAVIRRWELPAGPHPAFVNGTYCVPRDGLYAVYVRVTPISGDTGASVCEGGSGRGRKRKRAEARDNVDHVVRVEEEGADGEVGLELMDVGAASFGEVLHLRKGACVAVLAMPTGKAAEVQFKVELIMRKRKAVRSAEKEEDGLSARELKKRAKKKKRMERRELEQVGEGGGEGGAGKKEEERHTKDAGVKDGGGDGYAGGGADENEMDGESGEDWVGGFSSDDSGGK